MHKPGDRCDAYCDVSIPWIWKNDFLAGPGRGRRLGLLHGHQIADVGQHRLQVRHFVFVQTIDDAETQTRRAKTPTAPTDRGTSCGRACGRAGGRGDAIGGPWLLNRSVGEMQIAVSYTIDAFLFDTSIPTDDDAVTYV